MKTNTPLKPRGIRLSDEDWKEFQSIAKEESKRTNTRVTASDVVRFAGTAYLKDRQKRIDKGKPV